MTNLYRRCQVDSWLQAEGCYKYPIHLLLLGGKEWRRWRSLWCLSLCSFSCREQFLFMVKQVHAPSLLLLLVLGLWDLDFLPLLSVHRFCCLCFQVGSLPLPLSPLPFSFFLCFGREGSLCQSDDKEKLLTSYLFAIQTILIIISSDPAVFELKNKLNCSRLN